MNGAVSLRSDQFVDSDLSALTRAAVDLLFSPKAVAAD